MGFLKNEKGQMAIFIALFFQVLFVFFAMAINVGLVVHDKINLQNSVDIAAYYGAMKQAEVLNKIAHINYQMRQNYKLFVWRFRVLGTIGNQRHPMNYIATAGGTNATLRPEADADATLDPTICVSHSYWQEARDVDGSGATVCDENSKGIPALPTFPGGSGFVPGSNQLPGLGDFVSRDIQRFCLESGIFNFLFAARILAHFRSDGQIRKEMIRNLATNLGREDPLDIRNASIREGVLKTLQRNLTETNRGGFRDDEFEYFNSVASCGSWDDWLVDIRINPVIFFSDWNVQGDACGQADMVPNRQGASATRTPPACGRDGMDNLPAGFCRGGAFDFFYNNSQALREHWAGEPPSTPGEPSLHSSVGFEKNPWCMVYSAVRATTAVRKPFDPTGSGVTLRASGYAKPFGGRIGPWYGRSWPQGAANSQESGPNDRVDPRLPSRFIAGSAVTGNARDDVANYSRYPGDDWGMRSMQGLSAMASQMVPALNHTSRGSTPPFSFGNYDHLGSRDQLRSHGDPLARSGNNTRYAYRNSTPPQRLFELAAVAPDLFDAIYYSIEPRYYRNYLTPIASPGFAGSQFTDPSLVIYDFGSSKDGQGGPENAGVLEQVQDVPNRYDGGYPNIIRDWHHLLTGWHQRAAVDYTLDDNKFGACQTEVPNPDYPTTGNCVVGGRIGYSVKNVSREYLNSAEHALGGGATGSAGPIMNPPTF